MVQPVVLVVVVVVVGSSVVVVVVVVVVRQNIPWKIRHFATRFKARDLCLKSTIS